MRTFRNLILVLSLLSLLSLSPVGPPARAEGSDPIADLPVSFTVTNTNSTPSPCVPDGRTYTVRGHLVGPRSELESGGGDVVTVHLFGWEAGEWNWRLPVNKYDHAVEMARSGHVSLTIDMLGYDTSDHPHGNDTCIGAQADMAHQIVGKLRSKDYTVAGAAPVGFSRVVLAGHDIGGLVAELEASTYGDVDGLIVVTWADQGFTPWVLQRATEAATTRCGLHGERAEDGDPTSPKGYVHFVDEHEFTTMLFHDAEPRVVEAAVRLRNRNPCGMHRTVASSVTVTKALLGTIDVPVLVAFGAEDDTVWTKDGQRQQEQNFTGSDDVTTAFVPGSGHFPMFEKTAEAHFRPLLSGWLLSRFPATAAASSGDADLDPVSCTWGGTPVAPTGVVSWDAPGISNTPAAEPVPFTATGLLEGEGCTAPDGGSRTMTFDGHYHAGSSCVLATDDGTVTGLPGVAREETVGVLGLVAGPLYDADDEVVGTWYAQVFTDERASAESCQSEEGIRELSFSGGVQLTYRP